MIIKDSISELKETIIWNYLNDIDSHYAERAVSFVEYLTPILKSIQEIFPFYTRHDTHHSYKVLNRISQVIHPDCLIKGNELGLHHIDAFLLICSAYAHDLGMAVFPGEEDELLQKLGILCEEDWKYNSELQAYLRNHHSERGGKFINQHYKNLCFPKNLVMSLHLLMRAHNMSINELDGQLSVRFAGGDKEIDLKQLACILCVADSLEFSETRIVDGVIDMLKDKIKNKEDNEYLKSYMENMKHVCIGDSLAIGNDGRIIISGTFDDPEVLNLAHKTIDYIEDWVRKYTDIDSRAPLKRLLIQGDTIVRNLVIMDNDFVRLGIRIKKDHIINLISSNSTWNNPSVAIKELLQNSVEACRFRLFHSTTADNYIPLIKVTIIKEDRKILLSDNGCGMSRNIILDNFLNVGNSRSLDLTYSNDSYKSLARFGIGFWSSFTISSNVDIVTAPFEYLKQNTNKSNEVDGLQFSVSVSEFTDYTLFKKTSQIPGTTITLYIKSGINLDDLFIGLNNMLLCSEIPIEFWNDNEQYHVPNNVVLPTLKEITKAKYESALYDGIKEFVYEKSYGDFDFKMKLLYRTDNNCPTFMLKQGGGSIMQLIPHHFSLFKVAICGFAVNKVLFDIMTEPGILGTVKNVGAVMCNINNPDGFIFNIQRLELLPSNKEKELTTLITEYIHVGYRQFLLDHKSFNKKTIYELNMQSRINLGNLYGRYTNKSLFVLYSKFPDLLSFKLYEVEVEKDLSTANITYLSLDELCFQKYELWSCIKLN